MRTAYRVLAQLVALGVAAQAAFVAMAWFSVLNAVDEGEVFSKDYEYNLGHLLHAVVGMGIIPILALALLVVSFFAKVPRGAALAGAVVGLVALQVLLAIFSYSLPAVGALHGLNAIALLGISLYAARRASTAPAPETTAPARESV